MHVAVEYCARSVAPGVALTVVVPDVTAATVSAPAPYRIMLICVPTANACEAFVGIWATSALALEKINSSLSSPMTNG
jgi:hypothetical protein